MNVGKICVHEADTVTAGETAFDAAIRMRAKSVGALIVVGEARVPVGIVTDRDLVTRVVALEKDPGGVRIETIMTKQPVVVAETASPREALERMREQGLRRLPVVGADGRLVGIVSAHDVLHFVVDDLGAIGEVLDQRSHRSDVPVNTGTFAVKE